MRAAATREKILLLMEEIGKAARSPGRIYIVGSSSALLLGIRDRTLDINLKLDPEPEGVFEAISEAKNRLAVNVELAAPDQFIPPLPGWQVRSEHIMDFGPVSYYHYDFYGQALAKIERGYDQDLSDALALVQRGKVDVAKLRQLFDMIRPELLRYPAVDEESLTAMVNQFISESAQSGS